MSDFKWIGEPVDCVYQSFNTGKFVFYRSIKNGNEIFSEGDFVLINRKEPGNPQSDEVCKIKALYESKEKIHREVPHKVFIQPYVFARSMENVLLNKSITFKENEVVEDCNSVHIIINALHIKSKCTVEFYPERLPVNIIHNSGAYYCRYRYLCNDILPVISADTKQVDNSIINREPKVSSKFNSELVRDEQRKHLVAKSHSVNGKNSPISNKQTSRLQLSEESCEEKHSRHNVVNSPLHSVRKNLCESFNYDEDNDNSYLDYSIIENTPEEKKVKIKLRVSKRRISSVPSTQIHIEQSNSVPDEELCNDFLVANKLNKSITECSKKKAVSPIVIIENNKMLTKKYNFSTEAMNGESPVSRNMQYSKNSPDIRRSTRAVTRISYADYVSPIKSTPSKRTRLTSVQSDSSENSFEVLSPSPRKSQNTKSKKHRKKPEDTPRKKNHLKLDDESLKHEATPLKKIHSKLVEESMKSTPKKTPTNRIKLLRSGTITPSVQNRNKAISSFDSPLMKARNQLHVSYVPKALPCREKEYQDIYNFLSGKLADGCGGCIYVSGVPGTGKTAIVTSVINNLLEDAKKDLIDDFYFININGMKLTEPRQAYVEIMRQLSKKTLPWEQAQTMLEERFTKSKQKNRTPIILLVDELDILCTKRQDVVYNLLDWPMKAKTLIVVTIANTMDLPERLLMNRVTSRLGLTRLTFQAYTHKQLQEIVMQRLTGTNSFNPDAIQLVARKVASVSGDARRALDICRRAVEIAELEGPDTYVSLNHVNEALNAMITQPKVQAIKHCSYLEQLVLQSVVAEMERTGVEETVFSDVFKMLISVSAIHGFKSVNSGIALAAVRRLSASRLLISDQKCSNITQRIILNVSTDDVYYALRKD